MSKPYLASLVSFPLKEQMAPQGNNSREEMTPMIRRAVYSHQSISIPLVK